mmetsp:Transcript_48850/g.35949  ORF Transcript_48850/g.35949 Transcript_48850/m.35949 type:complete len:106 (-) Transcript_48850:261-578(-)
MFKSHPRKAQIRFVVLPIVREVLETSNDIATPVDLLLEIYKPGSEILHGLHFDFSLMFSYGNPDLWQIFTLANLGKQKELIQQLRAKDGQLLNLKEVMIEAIGKN